MTKPTEPVIVTPTTTNNVGLMDYIRNHTFRRFIVDDKIIDTRPFVGVVHDAPKPSLTGLRFNGFGFVGKYTEKAPPTIENIGFLPVPHFVAGQNDPVAAANWSELLGKLPPGSCVFADEWTESNHHVGIVKFIKKPDGSWVHKSADEGKAA